MPATDNSATLIYLSGNNGSGKSTLGRVLAPRLGFTHLPQENIDQSYLCDLFSQPKRWSFEAQAHFLTFKTELVKHSFATSGKVFIDRSPYEDAEIFARYFHQTRRLGIRAYRTYQQLYHTLVTDLPEPTLLIYCTCSSQELERRVSQRGREYEQLYPKNHLKVLDQLYQAWITRVSRQYPGRVFSVDTETHNLMDADVADKLASELRYFLESGPNNQLSLFAPDLSCPEPEHEKGASYGMLTPVVPSTRKTPSNLLRKPIAYIAAPFTGKATEPGTEPLSSGEDSQQQRFESWPQPGRAHGTITDSNYRAYLENLEMIIREAGFQTFLPHRDANKWGERELTPSQAASECTRHVFESDVLIALPEFSLGAHYEVGVALGYGLPIVVLISQKSDTSFIMQGLDSQPSVSILTFSSQVELRERLTRTLTGLASYPLH